MPGEDEEAKRTVAVDFDGTIAQWGELGPNGELLTNVHPEPGAKEALVRLREAGYRILIHSARSWEGYGERALVWEREMLAWLDEHEIPWDGVHFEQGKPPALAYVDDRGIRYEGNWKAITDWLLYSEEKA